MISAVILNYLNPALTEKSVIHLLQAAEDAGIQAEVIVVDNSAPQTALSLRKLLPDEVKIIENEENLGFSAANNQGIKKASGEIILIMNNDLFINKEVLKKGVEYVTSNEKAGVWGPKLIDQYGDEQRTCSNFPTLTDVINEYLFNRLRHNRVSLAANQSSHPVCVDAVIGACMFIPQKVIVEAGLFDEAYFFNVEDIDLCYKIRKLGYEVVFDPRCEAVHLTGASQNHDWYDDPYMHESRKIYYKKHFNPLKAMLTCGAIDAGIFARKLKHRND